MTQMMKQTVLASARVRVNNNDAHLYVSRYFMHVLLIASGQDDTTDASTMSCQHLLLYTSHLPPAYMYFTFLSVDVNLTYQSTMRTTMSTLFTKLRSADVSTCVVPPTLSSYLATELLQPRDLACGGTLFQSGCVNDIIREVAVRELGGTLFRQIFWEPEWRSGKYRWPQVER